MSDKKMSDKKYFEKWQEFRDNFQRATPVDLNETHAEKLKRIEALEKDDEAWFKYYFPNYYSSEPARFHKRATKRVMNNPEWFEVRSWSRELAKSARTMMEVLKLGLTGKKKNILFIAATYDDACRLLLPYKSCLESNNRIINDYGLQESLGTWEAGEFKTKKGLAFRALGAGQSPRGTRSDEIRPDVILIDDIDTDKDCRNPKLVQKKIEYIEQAAIPTRSISVPLLIIVCGNIIAKYCVVNELGKKADIHEIVNIRDKHGKSTWPQKNSEALIDIALRTLTTSSIQKEYYNNPVNIGKLFQKVAWGKCPPLKSMDVVLIYADPGYTNKTTTDSSKKAIGVIGKKGTTFYLYKVWLDKMLQSDFVKYLYDANAYVKSGKVDTFRTWIENNSLQEPFFEQVIKPLIREHGRKTKTPILYISKDTRAKGEKYARIEGTLEPIYKSGEIIFNEAEKDNTHMKTMAEEFIGVDENSKMMDGPDMLEGGVYILKNAKTIHNTGDYQTGQNAKRGY